MYFHVCFLLVLFGKSLALHLYKRVEQKECLTFLKKILILFIYVFLCYYERIIVSLCHRKGAILRNVVSFKKRRMAWE